MTGRDTQRADKEAKDDTEKLGWEDIEEETYKELFIGLLLPAGGTAIILFVLFATILDPLLLSIGLQPIIYEAGSGLQQGYGRMSLVIASGIVVTLPWYLYYRSKLLNAQ